MKKKKKQFNQRTNGTPHVSLVRLSVVAREDKTRKENDCIIKKVYSCIVFALVYVSSIHCK